MITQHIHKSIQNAGVTTVRWGLGLGLAALGIALVLLTRPVQAQTDVPEDPATQAVWAYLVAHGVSRPTAGTVPDAATQGVLGYLRAHGLGQAPVSQPADPNTQGVLGYLRAHESVPISVSSAVPDAATLGVLGYLRTHGLGAEPEGVGVTTATTAGPLADWTPALALVVLVGGLIALAVWLGTHARPGRGGGPAHQQR